MNRWLGLYFIEPLIRALACEWGAEFLLRNTSDVFAIKEYLDLTLKQQPRLMKFMIYMLSVLFLIFVRLRSWNSFSDLDSKNAIRYVRHWRESRLPGCAQLIQLFESLIALSMFSNLDSYDRTK